ncbi:MAG: diaminopimelate decarboxylase [Gammaproteobacteria bacterium]
MIYFWLNNNEWFVEQVSLAAIAKELGTPCYVYSKAALLNSWYAFNKAFVHYPHQINYAVKANSNLAILNILAQLDSGFDIVSIGELERVLKANGHPEKIIFSGVGKTSEELSRALQVGVGCINIESEAELLRLNQIAITLGKIAKIAIRVNPDIDANSHPYISTGLKENKFGVNILKAKELYQLSNKLAGIKIQGVAFHIGSQITSLTPFLAAIDQILKLIDSLKSMDIKIYHINVGGGLGVVYNNETAPSPQAYVEILLLKLKPTNLAIYIEPGRAIVANSGVLLTKVEYIKKQDVENKYFAIVDAAMNDLLRPALYKAWHNIVPVTFRDDIPNMYDIVGPICETSDFLGKDRSLSIKANDLLMVCSAGAYGFSMSSNYNSRPRAAEVIVDGENFYVVRPRENITDLFASEKILPN